MTWQNTLSNKKSHVSPAVCLEHGLFAMTVEAVGHIVRPLRPKYRFALII